MLDRKSVTMAFAPLFLLVAASGCTCKPREAAEPTASREETTPEAPSENEGDQPQPPTFVNYVETGDLPKLRERGTLRVLIEDDSEEFLPREGVSNRLDRRLAEEFAERQGLKLELIQLDDFDALIPALREGKADIIAADLTVTKARSEQVAFTWPLRTVSEVVIGKKGADGLPRSVEELAGREIHVRESSSFAETLRGLGEKAPGLKIVGAPEHLHPEEIAWAVSRGERPLTVIDSHMLRAVKAYNDQVEELFTLAEGRQIAWAVRQENPELKAALDTFLQERMMTSHATRRFTGDLQEIRKRKVLRVLTRNNPVTYFLHRGRQFGFDFELASLLAKDLGVRLEMVVPPSRDQLIPWLLEGRGDLIAAGMTATEERAKEVAFSRPYLFADEVLVQHASAEAIDAPEKLTGKKITVRASSSYRATLEALRQAHGPFEIIDAPEEVETEELIAQVANGEIDITVADSHLLQAELAWRDDVKGTLVLSGGSEETQKQIAFAMRPSNPELKAYVDGFVKKTYRGLEYNMAKRRYFENKRQIARAAEERSGRTGRISQYDPIIQKYATNYGFDWRLLAAQAYQESRFNPNATSWVGALGLFQVMPATGRSLGFTNLTDPDEGTHAGVKYMAKLVRDLDPKIPPKQRIRFALAAYNAGIGHLIDARRIARERGLDPNKWFGNVEKAMLELEKPAVYRKARFGYCRGSEPVKYVSNIQTLYGSYVGVVQD